MLGAVVIDSTNNGIRITENATTATATIAAGTYFLRGNYTTNLVDYSESIGVWAISPGVTATTGQMSSPIGGTAVMLTKSTAGTSLGVSRPATFTGNGTKVCSIYLKAGTAATTTLNLYDSTAVVNRFIFDITWSNGVPASFTTVGGSGSVVSSEHVGNGWYRIAYTVDSIVAANVNNFYVYPAGIGTATGTVYAWGAQAENATAVGPYVATSGAIATGPSDDLCLAIKTALEAATASTNTYNITVTRSIASSSIHTSVSIARATGADTFALLWSNALTTFAESLLGFQNIDSALDANAKTSAVTPSCTWVGSDIYREFEPEKEVDAYTQRALSGRVRGGLTGGQYSIARLSLALQDATRTDAQMIPADPTRAFSSFLARQAAGLRLELHAATIASGTTLATLTGFALGGSGVAWHFDEGSLDFRPQRLSPGVPLYAWEARLLRYVA